MSDYKTFIYRGNDYSFNPITSTFTKQPLSMSIADLDVKQPETITHLICTRALNSIHGIHKFTNLIFADLSNNDISTIDVIELCPRLKYLILRNNKISNLFSLTRLYDLVAIDVTGNSIDFNTIAPEFVQAKSTPIDIAKTYITDKNEFKRVLSCHNLASLTKRTTPIIKSVTPIRPVRVDNNNAIFNNALTEYAKKSTPDPSTFSPYHNKPIMTINSNNSRNIRCGSSSSSSSSDSD